MAAIAPIAIADGASTPVTHTFQPISSVPDALYRENLSGIALVGNGTLKVSGKQSKDGVSVNKVRLELVLPALETATAANSSGYTASPKVAYQHRAIVDVFLPPRGTAQQRKDLRVLLANALANAQIIDSIDNLATPY